MTPRASVIVPAYNAEKYVGEAVESVLAQEEGDFELIVVDDGSTDGTADVLSRFDDPRLEVVRTRNGGVSAARNVGLDRASAPVITFLDADDRWRPEKLRRELEVLDAEPEVGLTFCNFVRFNDDGSRLPDQFSFMTGLEDVPTRASAAGGARVVLEPAFRTFIGFYDFPAWSPGIAARREVVGDLRYRRRWWDEYGRLAFLEDLEYTPKLFRRTRVAYFPEPLLEVRRHEDNSTSDVAGMVVAQLHSLLALREFEELDAEDRKALDRRIALSWAGVGNLHVREGRPIEGVRCFGRALAGGRPKAAVKGLLRLPVNLGPRRVPRDQRPRGGRPIRLEGDRA